MGTTEIIFLILFAIFASIVFWGLVFLIEYVEDLWKRR